MFTIDKEILEQTVVHFHEILSKIKTGRASPAVIEDIRVEAYGSPMLLKELTAIGVPDSRQLLLSPYDFKNTLKPIESALQKANLGFSIQFEESRIRLILPPMTEETRKKQVSEVKVKKEEAFIKLRNVRHEFLDALKKADLPETETEINEKKIEDVIKEYKTKLEEMAAKKEKELMTI